MEAVIDFIFLGSQITVDGACSHEIKRCLLLGRKAVTNIFFAKSLQSCPTLCDPMDGSLPGSSVRGIFQARVLEWGAIAFSRKMMVLSPIFQSVRGRGLAWGSRWSLAQCTYYYSDDLYV